MQLAVESLGLGEGKTWDLTYSRIPFYPSASIPTTPLVTRLCPKFPRTNRSPASQGCYLILGRQMARKFFLILSSDLPSFTFLPWSEVSPLKSHDVSQLLHPFQLCLPGRDGKIRKREGGRKPDPSCLSFPYSICLHKSCGCHV